MSYRASVFVSGDLYRWLSDEPTNFDMYITQLYVAEREFGLPGNFINKAFGIVEYVDCETPDDAQRALAAIQAVVDAWETRRDEIPDL